MKHFLFIIFLTCGLLPMAAQSSSESQKRDFDDAFMHTDTLPTRSLDSLSYTALPFADSLVIETLPWQMPVEIGGYGFDGCAPFASGVYGSGWRLHKGLNAQFSLSVSAGLGKHAPKGVGFGQSAAFAYVLPLNSRFSIAAGIYAANMNWGSWRQTDVGFAGVLAYRVNENINLYAYGSKTFMPRNNPFAFRHDPFPVFYDRPRDRIGAAAEFKIGNNAVIGVSVEHRSY